LIEAALEIGALGVELGEHLIVLLLNLIGQGEIAGADAITDTVEAVVEFGAGDVFGFWFLRRQEFFGDGGGGGDGGGENGRGGGRGGILGKWLKSGM
jgi:hypothetical protein